MSGLKPSTNLELKFKELCSPVIEAYGLNLYHLEYQTTNKLLRLYIMDPKTQSAVIDDCVKVDHALSEPFEKESWIPEGLVLEVSSPGIYRPLIEKNHYDMSINQTISVTIMGQLPVELNKQLKPALLKQKKIRGDLKSVTDEKIQVVIDRHTIEIPFSIIKKAQLDPDINKLMSNKNLQGGRT